MRSGAVIIAVLFLSSCGRETTPAPAPTTATSVVVCDEIKPEYEQSEEYNADFAIIIEYTCLSGADRGRTTNYYRQARKSDVGGIDSACGMVIACGTGGSRHVTPYIKGSRAGSGVTVDLKVAWISKVWDYTGEAKGTLFVPWMGQAETMFDPEFLVTARFVKPPNFD